MALVLLVVMGSLAVLGAVVATVLVARSSRTDSKKQSNEFN